MLSYKGYYVELTMDNEKDVLKGKVAGVRQSLSFEATNAHDFKQAFFKCIDDYLADCEKQKKEPEKPFKGVFNVRISSDLHRKAHFASRNSNLNAFISQAIREKLERLEAAS